MREYICNSCGREIIGDATSAAIDCPYCGNHVVMANQFSGSLRPDYVIPFKLDKEAAKEALKKHLCGKRLLPKVFKNENHSACPLPLRYTQRKFPTAARSQGL